MVHPDRTDGCDSFFVELGWEGGSLGHSKLDDSAEKKPDDEVRAPDSGSAMSAGDFIR